MNISRMETLHYLHAIESLSRELPVEEHSYQFIHKALRKYFNFENVQYIPLDGKYWIAPLDNVKKEIEENHIDHRKYKKNVFDCENFAISLFAWWHYTHKSNQIGIAYSRVHGYNLVALPNKKIRLLEPQSDRTFSVEEAEKQEPKEEYPEKINILREDRKIRMDKAIEAGAYKSSIIQL